MVDKQDVVIYSQKKRPSEVTAIMQLWEQCFDDDAAYQKYYCEGPLMRNEVFGIIQNNLLVSMLHLTPYTLQFASQKVDAEYIVGVATREAYRRQGLMKQVMEASLFYLYGKNRPFVYLMPARASLYEKYGFGFIYESWCTKQPADAYNGSEKKLSYEITPIHQVRDGFRRAAHFVMNSFYKNDLVVKRTGEYYKDLTREMRAAYGDILVAVEQDQILAVFAYMADQGQIQVVDYFCQEETRSNQILSAILRKLKKEQEPEEFMIYDCRSLRTAKVDTVTVADIKEGALFVKSRPIIMGRIVSIPDFLALFRAKTPSRICIYVKDPVIEQQQGEYTLFFSRKRTVIEFHKEREQADMIVDIATLTQFFCGYLSVKQFLQETKGPSDLQFALEQIERPTNLCINEIV